ncbi:hypothetical protein DD238_004340 [Peronospora effusa]|uniref:Palmitoyl-protein thioesterase 1 n=1 Tax=Peronospora effusa TaxID=542832 RepID=A0A3M6VH79_9STRA|nr:hypothetical protein DD238_004340 [Peronospora effusa]RQM15716.1 hypothetical protein DD237_003639 [Peronospora effusa]
MSRANRLLLIAAGVIAFLVVTQLVLIKVESVTYFENGETLQLEDKVAVTMTKKKLPVYEEMKVFPVVLMHGMGDAARNGGMIRIQKTIAEHLGVYVANVQLGNSVNEDVENSFFVTMDNQTKMFAKIVREDAQLTHGFNAVGFSQGNLLIRAYIERFNDPPVYNFISFHGPLAGVGGLPRCSPLNFICKEIDKLIGEAVYTKRVQGKHNATSLRACPQVLIFAGCLEHLAQANYYRDPLRIEDYLEHAQFLPDLNNEKILINQTYKDNFSKLQNLVLVRANQDTQVFPKESEWFGMYEDGDPHMNVLGFNETRWYQEDLFGLKTLNEAGKVHFVSTNGDHLRFSMEFLLGVVDKYLLPTKYGSNHFT